MNFILSFPFPKNIQSLAVFVLIMTRTRYTFCPTASSEWVEQGKPSDPQNNSRDDTCQEQHLGAHHVDLLGKPDHISVNSEEEELSSGEKIAANLAVAAKTTTTKKKKTKMIDGF